MMRTVRMAFGIVRVAGLSVAVFSVVRVAVMSGVVVCVFLSDSSRPVMIEPEQMLDAAIRTRQQPEHHGHHRANAEGDMDFWLP